MAAEPSPTFRWGVLKRLSQYNTNRMANRPSEHFEESTTRQELDIVRHIKGNDLGIVVATYSDIASGWDETAKRPGFEAALDDLKAGTIDGIAVWKLDRLVRRVSQFRRVIDALEESGGRLLSVTEGIDTADPDRKFVNGLIMDLLARLAEMESDNHSVRTVAWHQQRAERGQVQKSRYRPFGHTDDWFGLVDEEVKLIHEAKGRIFRGESATSIARLWTDRGIPSRSGNPWHEDTIIYILTSPRMVAQREYGDALYDLEGVPAIFADREEWERLCAILNANRRQLGRKEWHLCSNVATCALCNRPLIGAQSGDGTPAYGCRKRRKEPGACGRIYIAKKYLDEIVTREAIAFLSDRERVMAVLASRGDSADIAAVYARESELSDSLVALAATQNPPPGVPRLPLNLYYEQVTAIEDERRTLARRMAVDREGRSLVEALDFGEAAGEVWAERGVNYQRQMLKLIVKRLEVRPGRVIRTKGKSGNSFDPERVSITFADE
jgi:site-specific DNA recombinase